MKILKVLQIRTDAPNPVTDLSGYEPTTDYWAKAIRMVNATIEATAQFTLADERTVRRGVDELIELEIFPDELPHTAVEWAEFVMSINHILWALDGVPKDRAVDITLEVLNDLYYHWHEKALTRLEGDDLSTYLRITD